MKKLFVLLAACVVLFACGSGNQGVDYIREARQAVDKGDYAHAQECMSTKICPHTPGKLPMYLSLVGSTSCNAAFHPAVSSPWVPPTITTAGPCLLVTNWWTVVCVGLPTKISQLVCVTCTGSHWHLSAQTWLLHPLSVHLSQ